MKTSKEWDRSARACLQCGLSYEPTREWQKTCCYECGYFYQNSKKPKSQNTGKCVRCSKSLEDKKSHAIYCSKTCKSMDHNFKHRSKTRTTSTARRASIYKRDGGRCYLCQKELDAKSFHLDHLIPVSRGGSNEPNNLAVACPSCNKSRGNRIEEAQLRKILELRNQI